MSQSSPTSPSAADQLQQRKPLLIVIFAVFVFYFSGIAGAQEANVPDAIPGQNNTVQFDAVTSLPNHLPPIAVTHGNQSAVGRPNSVDLHASLANFDADARPDGWRARVILLDREGRPIPMRSHATFELTPRIPLVGTRRHDIESLKPMRWSRPLQYDPQGVASVTLPLRRELQPLYGWTLVPEHVPFGTVRRQGQNRYRNGRTRFGRSQSVFVSTWREQLETPSTGILKVRVSVPTMGVYEAIAPIRLRPSSLATNAW